MVSATEGWAVGDHGCILRWNGSAWDPVFSPTWYGLGGVAMLSAQEGWAVGGSAFLHWDGLAWANMNAAPLSASSVAVLSSTDAWAAGAGIQHWDGRAWASTPSPTSRYLRGIALTSPAGGWAVGRGAILRYTGPTPTPQVFLPLVTLEQEVRHANKR
jgi:hypothetical protein